MKSCVLKCSVLTWLLCLLLVGMLGSSGACYIRNCPRGGKRSLGSLQTSKQCMSCGPELSGQCVGPSICCGASFGCMMGTPETEVCGKENDSPTPCEVRGQQCGATNMGNCVADGLCCVEDACSFNARCKATQEDSDSTSRTRLLSLVRRLLLNRQLD